MIKKIDCGIDKASNKTGLLQARTIVFGKSVTSKIF